MWMNLIFDFWEVEGFEMSTLINASYKLSRMFYKLLYAELVLSSSFYELEFILPVEIHTLTKILIVQPN